MIRWLPLVGYCFIITLSFSGCSTTQKSSVAALLASPSESSPASLLGTLPAAVPVEGLPLSFLHQQLIGSFSGSPAGDNSSKLRQIQAVAERNGDMLELVALSGAGLQLYKVSYDGKTLNSTKSLLLPEAFSPWQIVSDFMSMYADGSTLTKALQPSGWTVEHSLTTEQPGAAPTWQRTINNAEGLPVVAVKCPGKNAQSCFRSARLQNLQLNYGLTARTLAYENDKIARQGGSSERAAQPEHHAQQQNALGRIGRIARRPLSGSRRR